MNPLTVVLVHLLHSNLVLSSRETFYCLSFGNFQLGGCLEIYSILCIYHFLLKKIVALLHGLSNAYQVVLQTTEKNIHLKYISSPPSLLECWLFLFPWIALYYQSLMSLHISLFNLVWKTFLCSLSCGCCTLNLKSIHIFGSLVLHDMLKTCCLGFDFLLWNLHLVCY